MPPMFLPTSLFKSFAHGDVMRGQNIVDVLKVIEILQKGVPGLCRLRGIRARVQFVKNAKVVTMARSDGAMNCA